MSCNFFANVHYSDIVIKVTVVAPKVPLCYGCNFYAIFMPPTKKYENPWVGYELTLSGDMLDLNAITTMQRGPIVNHCFTNKYYSSSAQFSDRKKIRGYPSEPSLTQVAQRAVFQSENWLFHEYENIVRLTFFFTANFQ